MIDMNIAAFDEYIDDLILKRGKDYYLNGHIKSIEEIKKNNYIVEVAGTDSYLVQVLTSDSGDIVNSNCDCPYDRGEFCKHQVASFFALRDGRDTTPEKNDDVIKNNIPQSNLTTFLSKLTKNELTNMILDLAEADPDLETKLLYKYRSSEDEISESKKIIKEYINLYKKRGFNQWNHVDDALQGAYTTLEKAEIKQQRGDGATAVSLSLLVLSHAVDMLQYSDDSSGYLGDVMRESLAIISKAVSESIHRMGQQEKNALYTSIMKEAQRKKYDEWDEQRYELFKSILPLCKNEKIRQKFKTHLDKLLAKIPGDSWGVNWKTEQIKLIQLELIELYDGEKESLSFILENVHFSHFREKALEYYIGKKEYEKVFEISEQGVQVYKEYPGLVSQWRKYQLQAYEGLGNVEKQKELLLEFILHNEFEFYPQLKQLYSSGQWEKELQYILERFESQKYPPDVYVKILKMEKYDQKLLAYCRRSLSSITDLYPYLLENHYEEAKKIYIQFIKTEAEIARERRMYRDVFKLIKKYKKIFGEPQGIIDELIETYKRRPAFIEELEKMK